MHWSHALLMAELLLKAADKIDTIRPTAATKEDSTMGDQAPIDALVDTPIDAPVTIDNDPTATPTAMTATTDDGQSAVAGDTTAATATTQDSEPASASTSTQTIIANAVEQPAAAAPEPSAAAAQGSVADAPDALHQSISDLVKLAQILNGNPALFEFLKTLMPNAPSSTKV